MLFGAASETTEIGEDLGEPDEDIEEADWFASLPADMFERDLLVQVMERVRNGADGED
ncbi:hypothetical protein ACFO0N_13090 [Halobium salinum]|uniref:Uncharacterized protein n=1 Tax=Halobium salinum TaxID=1364940 RepID=A0ABD5PDT6_9EURY|nr:hypothetical protein [Halobium salinum]